MAYWTTPVTDREPGARMTWVDMNRITNNLNYLAEVLTEHQMYHGRFVDKTDWTWNDYVTREQWNLILLVLGDVTRSLGMEGAEEADFSTTYTNINIVETFTYEAYKRFEMYEGQGDVGRYLGTNRNKYVSVNDDYYLGGIQDPETNPLRKIRHYVDTEVYCADDANVGGAE